MTTTSNAKCWPGGFAPFFFCAGPKAEVAPELPPKTEMVRAVALDGAQLPAV